MATEDEGPADEGQGAHGPAAAGHGKHKGGLLNGPHREMIIMVASVVGVGLAYATLHRSAASGSSAAQTAAMGYPGSSAALSSGQVAGFDQAAVAGLQTMLANQSDQLRNLTSSLPGNYGAGSAPSTPTPLAAGLFAPSDSGQFVRYDTGTIAQIQSDGSLFGLTGQQWGGYAAAHPGLIPTAVGGAQPTVYSTSVNLASKNAPAPART